MSISVQRAFAGVDCEIHLDDHMRQIYATDASIYQIEPRAVAFPRTPRQASAVIRAAMNAGIPVTCRGAGTGLAGGAVGDGLIVELARYTRQISELDVERRTVRVGPGVVLDQLNNFLKPHGLCFGPDVATSSRATLGGMISNNSSGARAPIYGTTIDHVLSVDIVLADGTQATVGANSEALPNLRQYVDSVVARHAERIREGFPDVLVKRWPAYALDDCLRNPGDLSKIVVGSEGTLAAVTSAVLKLVTPPQQKGLGILFFATVSEAMQATVEILDLKPAAIEHVDKVLFDQTRDQLQFKAARDLLELDAKPCGAFLIVEFYDDVEDRLATLQQRKLGLRKLVTTDATEMLAVWGLRKAGLSILSGCKGPAKPIAGVEDVAVRPEELPAYVAALDELAKPLDLEMSYYGHAASGLLHVRPVVDLHRADSIAKYRTLAEGISALTRQFKGSLTGEHGVGIARAEFMTEHILPELLDVMRDIKAHFDPKGLMNPGKVFPNGARIDKDLRYGAGREIPVPFETMLGFVAKDESFVRNLEQCNGCGECRKDAPTMCPTFIATGDEVQSTRGRANTIRAVLEGRIKDAEHLLVPKFPFGNALVPEALLRWLRKTKFFEQSRSQMEIWERGAGAALELALSNCLSCKACKKECPSNVDMALLKAELSHARIKKQGVKLLERVVSRFDLLGKMGCATPGVANFALHNPLMRWLMEKTVGLAAKRPLPLYTQERFDAWFAKHPKTSKPSRGRVYLWNDCTVRYYEPDIGKAAVKVLEAAGFEVLLPENTCCCGRPAFSVGRLDVARRFGAQNLAALASSNDNIPIIFLEPSCYSMFKGDYEELRIKDARRVADHCFLFEHFVFNLLQKEPGALTFSAAQGSVAIHGHCHAKAITDIRVMPKLAQCVTGTSAAMIESGCCGMAGAFGALREKYDLSVEVARPLIEKINGLAPDTCVIASGTSCRQQITHLTNRAPLHMAEFLAGRLDASLTG